MHVYNIDDLRPRHRRALGAAGEMLAHVQPGDLARPTPCTDWDLQALLTHMIGQNDGFATAATTGDAPRSAYVHRAVPHRDLEMEWGRSADRILTAFANVRLDDEVRLVEIDPKATFPMAAAVSMQLLDTVIHTWDAASALGRPCRPDHELIDIVSALAKRVPGGTSRTRPGAAFAPAIATANEGDPWLETLALLGREQKDRGVRLVDGLDDRSGIDPTVGEDVGA